MPFEENYHAATAFLQKFETFVDRYQTNDNPTFRKDLWDIVSELPFESRNSNALPRSWTEFETAIQTDANECRTPSVTRSLEWLQHNGRCMDHIRPGNSTISQAGRGAFAARPIPEGGLVAPGPVLHIANRTALLLYDMDPVSSERDVENIVGAQLLLNYCFGNAKSSVLLCPYTSPSAYINHASGESSANAKVVWADASTPNHHADWLEDDVDFLKEQDHIGLSLNFIATRDIRPGEEVFLDYGPEWEKAWEAHVRDWEPPVGSEEFQSAKEVIKDYSTPLWTEEEGQLETHQHLQHIIFYCPEESEWEGYDYTPLRPCKIARRFQNSSNSDGEGPFLYDVVMLTEDEIHDNIHLGPEYKSIPLGQTILVKDVPRSAIIVADEMYSKDEYMRGTFRHEMMIPDDVFPKTWMNL